MLRYAITQADRFGEGDAARQAGLLADAERWAAEGMDYVQLREKDLLAGDLLTLTRGMVTVFRRHGGRTKLLVNGRADVAVGGGADGVHLTAHPDELTPEQVRRVFALAGVKEPVVSVSAHTLSEVERARDGGADLILFGPVFEKRVGGEVVVEGTGLERLREACVAAGDVPVLALGGVISENACVCLGAGAAGTAGIRLFA